MKRNEPSELAKEETNDDQPTPHALAECLLLGSSLLTSTANAQENYPHRPVNIVVPSAPGARRISPRDCWLRT